MTGTPSASAAQSAGASSSTAGSVGSAALNSLSSNYNNFLQLLTTQLRNQDPSSPMDANQFTSELVQFSSVQQQIDTNTSLGQLIQLTQAGQVLQSSAVVGKQVTVQSNQVSLQSGSAGVRFNGKAGQLVDIAISSTTGQKLLDAQVTANQGQNSWTWNGTDSAGRQLPDGVYNIAVTASGSGGTSTAMPFTTTGTATGVLQQNGGLQLQLGSETLPFSAVRSIGP